MTPQELAVIFNLKKIPTNLSLLLNFPSQGGLLTIDLQDSRNGRIKFNADVNRKNKINDKLTLNLRYQESIFIRRLDFMGSHRNPVAPAPDAMFEGFEDYEFIREDHLHFYIEGYHEKWALPLTHVKGLDILPSDDLYDKMAKFFDYCNIDNILPILPKPLII